MADRPTSDDTPMGKELAKQRRQPPKKPVPKKLSNFQMVKKAVIDYATGGAYDKVSNPPWQNWKDNNK